MKIALLQLNVSDDPAANLIETRALLREAVAGGAAFVLTPEVTNCVSTSRTHQQAVLAYEEDDATLAALREEAAKAGIWLLIGSLALKTRGGDGRFANRSFLISPQGEIVARYDKIHMFDVDISATETYRESAGYRPGDKAVVAETPFGKIGMSVCYDMRFPALYQALAEAGARILTMPAAFSPVTGPRIGTAYCGRGRLRMAAMCWPRRRPARTPVPDTKPAIPMGIRWSWPLGGGCAGCRDGPGVYFCDMDMEECDKARAKVPSLANRRPFAAP